MIGRFNRQTPERKINGQLATKLVKRPEKWSANQTRPIREPTDTRLAKIRNQQTPDPAKSGLNDLSANRGTRRSQRSNDDGRQTSDLARI